MIIYFSSNVVKSMFSSNNYSVDAHRASSKLLAKSEPNYKWYTNAPKEWYSPLKKPQNTTDLTYTNTRIYLASAVSSYLTLVNLRAATGWDENGMIFFVIIWSESLTTLNVMKVCTNLLLIRCFGEKYRIYPPIKSGTYKCTQYTHPRQLKFWFVCLSIQVFLSRLPFSLAI